MPRRTAHTQTPQSLDALAAEFSRLATTLSASAGAMRSQELDAVTCYNLAELRSGLKKVNSFVDLVPRQVRETLFEVGSLGEGAEDVVVPDDDEA